MSGTENNELADFSPEELAMVEADRAGVVEQPEAKPEQAEEVQQEKTEVQVEAKQEVKPPEGFVPHGALHEERARRKEIQKELQQLREEAARKDERLKMLTEGHKQPDPSFDDDPLGYSKREIERVRESVDGISKQYPNQLNELKGEIEAMRLQRSIEKQEMAFEKENPDYRDALNYYVKTRKESLEDAGFDEEEAVESFQQELQSVISRSMQAGKNPAEAVYKMASKIGFKSTKQENKIESLKKAETASKSLSDNSGKAKTELSAESLAEMSDEDFMKISDDQFRKAMGG